MLNTEKEFLYEMADYFTDVILDQYRKINNRIKKEVSGPYNLNRIDFIDRVNDLRNLISSIDAAKDSLADCEGENPENIKLLETINACLDLLKSMIIELIDANRCLEQRAAGLKDRNIKKEYKSHCKAAETIQKKLRISILELDRINDNY